MCTKAEGEREQGMTMEPHKVLNVMGRGMERWAWNGKLRSGKISWSLS